MDRTNKDEKLHRDSFKIFQVVFVCPSVNKQWKIEQILYSGMHLLLAIWVSRPDILIITMGGVDMDTGKTSSKSLSRSVNVSFR